MRLLCFKKLKTMATNNDLNKKWAELLDYAQQHATGQGSRTGFRWLEDSFNEYFQAHEDAVEKGTCASFGGQSYSQHNREVLAEKICLELGQHVGGQHLINENQEKNLKESLDKIVNSPQRSWGCRR